MEVFKPVRVERTYVQKICAPPEAVFPLLCPVREKEWVEGWDPSAVYSESGFAENDCVFVTGESGEESVWVITVHDPDRFLIEMIKVTPGATVGKIGIVLRRTDVNATEAHIRYTYTALGAEGEAFVHAYSEEYFVEFMSYWESALNEFLCSPKASGSGA